MARSAKKRARKKSARVPRRLEVRVVVDTNQLFNGSASDLLNKEAVDLLAESQRHQDVRFIWYLPEVVRLERRYQMIKAARDLLPNTQKLERLLGQDLGVTEEVLVARVDAVIEAQIAQLKLSALPLDDRAVDWQRLIRDSADRQPPFEVGKTEKGFRDSIIVESFLQLVGSSPVSPKSCRVVLVSNDGRVREAVTARSAAENLRVLASLDDLKNFMNLLVSDVAEEFVDGVRPQAMSLFFSAESKTGVFYDSKLRSRLSKKFEAKLEELPSGAASRSNGTWYIGPTHFARKAGQRLHWVTTISIEASAHRQEDINPFHVDVSAFGQSPIFSAGKGVAFVPSSTPLWTSALSSQHLTSLSLPGLNQSTTIYGTGSPFTLSTEPTAQLAAPPGPTETREVRVATGKTVLEVMWSVTATAAGKLTKPTVDGMRFVENIWEPSSPPRYLIGAE